ncbi:HIRAN domain-containing protein [Variovorax sp. JS1663]|uniref:HIRAN domain-containing protein n=1 Tax=Variovorax sp. JS1663 TaxID=1851577 RepID=UPI00307B577B
MGAAVELRIGAQQPYDAEAISVWLRCGRAFGLVTFWKRIGYVKSAHTARWAWQLDAGLLHVERAVVSNSCTATELSLPRVSIQIELRHT